MHPKYEQLLELCHKLKFKCIFKCILKRSPFYRQAQQQEVRF